MGMVWFSIDNQFCVDVPDDATWEEIEAAAQARLAEIVRDYDVKDYILSIEEE